MEKVVDLGNFYWILGVVIFMNVGTIFSVLIGAGRAVWFIAKLDSRVTKNESDINAAHTKIRNIENGEP